MRSILLAGLVASIASSALAQSVLPAAPSPQLPAAPALPAAAPVAPAVPAAAAASATPASTGAGLTPPPQLPPPSACPGNPDALGVSRVIAIDPKTSPFLGRLQYKQTLPLEKGEVVLTFDDGPLAPMTTRVLDTLAHECVKATFFIVGRMAHSNPHLLQRTLADGHTIGTHSETHPLIFPKLTQEAGVQEIEQGFASVTKALAPVGAAPNPWFRFPGLGRTKFFEAYTQEHGIAVFSVDEVADDWMHLKPEEVEKRALDRLEARGGGILLLHDIQPATAVMLPNLLRELKARGFRIVHVVPATAGMVASLPGPGPRGHIQPAAASATTAAPGTAPAKPAQPKPATAPKPATPATAAARPVPPTPRTTATTAAAPAEPAATGAPQAISPHAQAGDGGSDAPGLGQFWPRLWNDTMKGLSGGTDKN